MMILPGRSVSICCSLALLLCLLPIAAAMADQVSLKNGDRLSGRIASMQDGTLVLKTSYADELRIPWSDVASFQTMEPVRLELADGTVLRGIIRPIQEGRVKLDLEQLQESASVRLDEVASINVEPSEKPAVKLRGRLNLGASLTRGNTETQSYHADSELVARTEKNRYTVGVEYNRAEDEDELTENSYLGYGKYDHFFSKKWYGYTNTLFERDEFKDLKLRSTAGLGMGYQFLESEWTNLSLEAGLSYVNSDYEEGQDESTSAARWSLSFDRYLVARMVQLFHFQEGFAGLEETDTLLIRSRTGLRLPIRDGFSATAQFNYDWSNSPPPGEGRDDLKYIFSLGYAFE